MQFGAKSERLPEEQMQLGLEALEQSIAKGEAEAEKRDPGLRKDNAARRRASRGALLAHLPWIEVTLVPDDKGCTGQRYADLDRSTACHTTRPRIYGGGDPLSDAKPVVLLERIIEASSNEGDLILDPFCGCGIAVHAARVLHRR
jgi:DNA modification methylase